MVFSVLERLLCFLPVRLAKALNESGLFFSISRKSALFSSLKSAQTDRIEVTQMRGSDGRGFRRPAAISMVRR